MNHHRLWRPRTANGRWRWLLFDCDVAWGGFWSQQPAWRFNMLAADLTPDGSLHGHNTDATTFLLRHLAQSAEFRRDFINRFQDLLNTTFLPSNTLARIDELASVLAPEMEEHIGRWRSPPFFAEWQRNVRDLRIYGLNRPQYAREQLRKQFGLPSSCALVLAVTPDQGGTIRLNTLSICSGASPPWTGLYFKDHPLILEAQPSPGFQFQAWDGLPDGQARLVTLSLTGDLALRARFVPDLTTWSR
jgi:CotH kinase protein